MACLVEIVVILDSIGSGSGNLINRTRYPNTHPKPRVPATVFAEKDSELALSLAGKIYEKAGSYLRQNNVSWD